MTEAKALQLPPPVVSGSDPPYHLLSERPKEFERLTRALLATDKALNNVDLYGLDGQKQYGVDVVGHHVGEPHRDVASSKCYLTITAGQLKGWSDDFLKHRETKWSDVRRFVLVTAAENVTDTKLLDQRDAEIQRFARLNIGYELWGPSRLTELMQVAGRPTAVRFLGEDWARTLFGADAAAELSAKQIQQVSRLQGLLSDQVDARLVRAGEQLRSGEYAEVETLLKEVRQPGQWEQLRAAPQARALRLSGSLALAQGDIARARKEAEAALELAPEERRLVALITYRERDVQAGLDVLGRPVSRGDRQMEVALLIEAERLAEASEKIEALVDDDPDDPESLRLLAHVQLVQNERVTAAATADRALSLAPRNVGVQRTQAITRYALALSPLAPVRFATFPSPADRDLTLVDDQSQAGLRAAADTFEKLATGHHPLPADRLWQLACLANLADGDDAASALCRELLVEDPASSNAILWGASRGLQFDREKSRSELEARYAAGIADEYQIRVLGLLVTSMEGPEAAAAAIRAGLAAQTGDALAAAQGWIHAGGLETAQGETPVQTILDALASADRRNDWSEIERLLNDFLNKPTPQAPGLALASEVGVRSRWRVLVPHVDALATFRTATSVMLGAFALHHAGSAESLLAFLGRNRVVFPGQRLPIELRRMEMIATERMGNLPGAIALAEAIIVETGELRDRLHLADIHIQAADIQAALPAVRMALPTELMTPDRALRYSMAVTREDPNLARDLWHRTMSQGVPDNLLLHALSQGYKLGLNAEAEVLMPRLHARAASGAKDVWMVDVDDVVREMVARRDRSRDLSELLAAGALPIHLLAGALNLSIADQYWLAPRSRERGALRPLFIRHGGRPDGEAIETPWRQWRVHLDLTALLIADQLDLWPHLDALESAVLISRALPDAILKLEHDALHHQVSQVQIAKAIVDAYAQRRLTLQTEAATAAETVLHERTEGDRPGEAGPTVRSVAMALAGDATGAHALESVPTLGSRLVFEQNTLETLAMDGHLEALLEAFQCEAPQSVIDEAVETVRNGEARNLLAEWIGEVRKQVALRLEDGRFAFAQPHSVKEQNEDDEDDGDDEDQTADEEGAEAEDGQSRPKSGRRRRDFIEQSLMDLLAAPGGVSSFLWVDDRNLTGYPMAENKAVVGILEVLDALESADRITADERRDRVLRLRAGGAVFLPMRRDDVLAALAKAKVQDGAIVETDELRTLRRNLATAVRLDSKLKLGATDIASLQSRPDELPFMLTSRRLVHECLTHMWGEDDGNTDDLIARSNWLWAAMRQEQPVRVLPGGDELGRLLAALNIASLLSAAPHLGSGGWKKMLPRRQAFIEWLSETAIDARVDAASEAFLDLVCDHLATLNQKTEAQALASQFEVPLADAEQYLFQHRARLFDLCPPSIQERLVRRSDFIEGTGIGMIELVSLNGVSFEADKLWKAYAAALRDGTAPVSSQGNGELQIHRLEDGLELSGALELRTREAWFPVLAAPADERATAIDAFLESLDLLPTDLERARTGALSAEGAITKLVDALRQAWNESVVHNYAYLSDALRSKQSVEHHRFLPPKAARLLHHLGLSDLERSVDDQATESWSALSERIGAQKAFRRVAGLPLRLADTIAATLKASGHGIQELGPAHSPVAQLHLAASARRLSQDSDTERQLAQVLAGTGTSGRLFAALLDWTANAYCSDAEWRSLPTGHQLALVWSHAHRICTILLELGHDTDAAREFFRETRGIQDLGANLWRNREFDADCSSPDNLFPTTLVFHGLAYVFGDADVFQAAPSLAEGFKAFPFVDEERQLQAGLVVRGATAENALNGFMNDRPTGLLPDGPDPIVVRREHLETAVANLEEDATDPLQWVAILGLGKPSLPSELRAKLDGIFDKTKLADLRTIEATSQGAAIAVDTRTRFGGDIPSGMLDWKVHEFAKHLAAKHKGAFAFGDGSPAAVALNDLLEATSRTAVNSDVLTALNMLADSLLVVADGWPSSAPALRTLCDSYARAMSPEVGAPIWRAFVALRAWP